MKLFCWFLLCIALAGVVMLIAGLPKAGGLLILGTTAVEVIFAAVVGKKSNAGAR